MNGKLNVFFFSNVFFYCNLSCKCGGRYLLGGGGGHSFLFLLQTLS